MKTSAGYKHEARVPIFVMACALAGPVTAQQAQSGAIAGDYPSRAVRLVVPFAPGGGTDLAARLIAQGLTESWGQPVVVANQGGAGGVPGVASVAKAAPDGYTMLFGSNANYTITPALHSKLPYDPFRDLAPVSLVGTQTFAAAVHPSLPVKSIKDLVALAKRRPGDISYGSGGSGGASHLATELLSAMTGISLLHVAYKGTAPGLVAVMSGEIQLQMAGLTTVLPYMKNGRIKVLAVTGARRSPIAPELPTIAESGVPGYEFDVWYGIAATGGTPREVVARANAEIVKVLKSPAVGGRFSSAGIEMATSTSEEMVKRIGREIQQWQKLVKAAGIRAD